MDRRVDAPRLTPGRLVALVLALLVATAAAFAVSRAGSARSITLDRSRILVATVESGAFHEYVPLIGTVQPRATVYLDAVDGGQVAEVLVEEGALVEAGQPLVRLNNTHLQLQVINSEAQLSEQLNRLASTKLLFEQSRLAHSRDLIDTGFRIGALNQRIARMAPLVASGIITRAELEDAGLELERLKRYESEVRRASEVDHSLQKEQIVRLDAAAKGLNRNLDLARRNLESLVIRSPVAGQLAALEAHVGESKSPGQRIGQVDQTEDFKVEARVDEHYLARVAVGQSAIAELAGQERSLVVTKVYPQVRDREFKVDLRFASDTPASIRRGQTLQVRLQLGEPVPGIVLANGPYYDDAGGQWVFVLSASGQEAERRPVRLGRRNPEFVEVLEGLEPGDRVITSSYDTLEDFDLIKVRGNAS